MSNPAVSSTSLAARIGWGALVVVTLAVCYFSNLGAIGFVGPDEPRYAWIARDMAESGDWVTPRLYGKPWFEKPVLYYWMAGASFKVFGVSEAAARLPSALCALFATLALAWLAWRIYGQETARWLLLLLPTSVGMIGFSHAASTDMPFSGMLTVAMVCAAVALGLTRDENTPVLPRTPWLALLLFGFFLGLAVLAKGPAAIILCGGAVFFWALITKRWRDAFRLLQPAAIASFCATALPWYILCARRNPDFFRIFIIEHNFKRYLTPEFQHIQPIWYYIPVVTVAALPWTAVLFWALHSNIKKFLSSRAIDPTSLLFWLLFAFCILFFSTSKSKLPGYILPAIPAAAFAMSVRVGSAGKDDQRRLCWYAGVGAALLLVSGTALDPTYIIRLSKVNPVIQALVAFLLMFVSMPTLLLASWLGCKGRFKSPAWAHVPTVLWLCGGLLLPLASMLQELKSDLSARPMAETLKKMQMADADIAFFHMQRGKAFQFNFYLRRELQEVQPGQTY
jgi:4-amino-4-deoxy-L-arabinose transferase-like glycosyltransferase